MTFLLRFLKFDNLVTCSETCDANKLAQIVKRHILLTPIFVLMGNLYNFMDVIQSEFI